jgi:hypothetical protein
VFRYAAHFLFFVLVAPIPLAAELRDPTLPGNLPSAPAKVTPRGDIVLNLSAIWVSPQARRAVINGVSVTVGHTLPDGSLVVKIQPSYVLIRQHGAQKKLSLIPSVLNPVK